MLAKKYNFRKVGTNDGRGSNSITKLLSTTQRTEGNAKYNIHLLLLVIFPSSPFIHGLIEVLILLQVLLETNILTHGHSVHILFRGPFRLLVPVHLHQQSLFLLLEASIERELDFVASPKIEFGFRGMAMVQVVDFGLTVRMRTIERRMHIIDGCVWSGLAAE